VLLARRVHKPRRSTAVIEVELSETPPITVVGLDISWDNLVMRSTR
jgi:hypothetical protein